MTREEKVVEVAKRVAQNGWTSIYDLANKLTDEQLEDYSHLWDDEEEESNGKPIRNRS